MSTQVAEVKDYGLGKEKETELTIGLETVKDERKLLIQEFKEVSKLEITQENLPKFRSLRLKIGKNRTQGINVWHKKTKDFFLTGGKFVDSIKNKENDINEKMELKLMEAEKHFENLEVERLQQLHLERAEELSQYVDDAYERALNNMEQDVWESYLATKKKAHLDLIQAELDAEIERQAVIKAEKVEAKRVEEENKKLLAEANKRAELAEIEAEKRHKENQEIARLAKIESDKKEKEHQDILAKEIEYRKNKEKEDLLKQNKIDLEREEQRVLRDKLESELKAKEDEHKKAIADEKLRIQNELSKGDSAKVRDLISDLKVIEGKYSFESDDNKKMFSSVNELLVKVVKFIEK